MSIFTQLKAHNLTGNRHKKLPDGPQTHPLVQMLHWLANPLGYMEAAREQYGDIFTARVGWNFTPIVFVSNPQAIEHIFRTRSEQFSSLPQWHNNFLKPLVGENSIIMLDGERRKRRRKLLMPPFHGERMRVYGKLIGNITEQVMNEFKENQTFLARDAMLDISMQVILEAVFGLRNGERCQLLKQLIFSCLDYISSPLGAGLMFVPSLQWDLGRWSPWGYFRHLQRQIDRLLYAEIRERRQQYDPERTDILSLLISARDEAGEGMTDLELRDELLELLFAGHETTATAMTWLLHWVHHLPDVRNKLIEELDTLGENPEPMTIARLPYLTAVCQESLRIYPVAMQSFPRLVKSPVKLMGQELQPGTAVSAIIYLTHHREDLYPDSKQFKPERFLERQFSPYEFFPFGGGSHRCIGGAFSLFEMKLVLATILSNYQIELANNRPERPQRQFITIGPSSGVRMLFTGRRYHYQQSSPQLAKHGTL